MNNDKDIMANVMLVSVKISNWLGQKYDRKHSKDTEDRNGAVRGSAKVTKSIIPESESFKALQKAINAARNDHYRLTLPWGDNGDRIMASVGYMNYASIMRNHGIEIMEVRLPAFLADYPDIREAAPARLSGLYDPNDFPTVDEIALRFDFKISVKPVPSGADFRGDLGADTESIKNQITRETLAGIEEAAQGAFKRFGAAVSHMVETLNDGDKKFKDSLVTNLAELCDLLPALNITKDPKLTELANQIRKDLIVDPDTLRQVPARRQEIADKAKAIQDKMAGLYGGG